MGEHNLQTSTLNFQHEHYPVPNSQISGKWRKSPHHSNQEKQAIGTFLIWLLLIFSKLLERLIHNQMYAELTVLGTNNLGSGIRGHSTTTMSYVLAHVICPHVMILASRWSNYYCMYYGMMKPSGLIFIIISMRWIKPNGLIQRNNKWNQSACVMRTAPGNADCWRLWPTHMYWACVRVSCLYRDKRTDYCAADRWGVDHQFSQLLPGLCLITANISWHTNWTFRFM